MKALVIASILFFSLRAMSAEEVGESQKSECAFADQTSKRAAKPSIAVEVESATPAAVINISK